VHLWFRLNSVQTEVSWVSEWRGTLRNKRNRCSPYYFVKHRPDIQFLCLWFYCRKCLMSEVSVWQSAYRNIWYKDIKTFTLLFRKTSARYWAPSSPMLFMPKFIEVSVCVEKWRWKLEGWRIRPTVLVNKASAKYRAPSGPIQLATNMSFWSVCVESEYKNEERWRKRKHHLINF